MRRHLLLASAALLVAASLAAAEPPPLLTADGTVDKVGRDTLTVRPRGLRL